MKLFRIISIILCVCLSFSGVASVDATAVLQQNEQMVADEGNGLDAQVSYLGSGELVENAQAAFLYEVNSDTLMYAWNPDLPVSPSSLVKILTAYMAVTRGNLEDIVTVTEDVLAQVPYDAMTVELAAGEQMSLQDLVYCMMVGSANDAAAVIANHISGSQEAFVEEMNGFVQELGCTSTQLKNAHGLHNEEQFSTVRDLARILVAAMKNEAFMTFFSTVRYTVPATNLSEEREISSSNFLMNNEGMEIYYDSRVIGGRTGIADDGTRCLATAAESNGLQLICVLMGAESSYAEDGNTLVYGGFKESVALYDAAFSGYRNVQILYKGQTLRQSNVINGTNDVILGSRTAVSAILPEGITQSDLNFRYSDIQEAFQAPVSMGEKLSRLEVWYGNICVAQADLFAMNTVESKLDAAQQAVDTYDYMRPVKIILTVVLSLFAVALVILFALRIISKMRRFSKNSRNRRYRRDRRRSH